MNIVIAGGTGLIGTKLVNHFIDKNDHVYILTRNSANKSSKEKVTYVNWLNSGDTPEQTLKNIDVFINLAGESINSKWTEEQKKRILNSRIKSTKSCIDLMGKLKTKPKVFLNASAVGFYGTSLTKSYTEEDNIPGEDFLASVVKDWEAEASKAMHLGIRTVLLRFGVVLAKDGGALAKMVLPYRLYVGGTIGSGQQWLSWVHLEDAIKMIEFAINTKEISGALNLTSPNPIQMKEFGQILASVMKKPHWFPTPSFMLKIALGEMSLLVLEGQKVFPKKSVDYGYQFSYPNLKDALTSLNL